MKKTLVYDLPTRFFHWLFAGLFVTAFLIAKTVDDDSPIYSYHMLAGFLLGFVVLLRIIWGFVGSKHARFSSFALHPQDLITYFLGVLSGDKRKWAGHNPASSWASLIMMGLALGLGVTGYFMATGSKESLEDIHEILANAFLVTVLMHIAGVVLHALRHRDGIALAMVGGKKGDLPSNVGIQSSRPIIAVLFLGFVATFALHLAHNYNSTNRTLNLFGTTLQLGENEDDEGSERGEMNKNHDKENDQEDDD